MRSKEITPHSQADARLQEEFNRWAEAGEGEKMEQHHLDITRKTIELMLLRRKDRVLDLGCGSGWATRLLARSQAVGQGDAEKDPKGQVVGVDVAGEMIRLAQDSSKEFSNVVYVCGSALNMPWKEISSTKCYRSNRSTTIQTRTSRCRSSSA